MKLHPLTLSQGSGPQTPPVKVTTKDQTQEDHVEKYRRERMAFILAMQRSPIPSNGLGQTLLVRLTQDPELEVALAACRAVNHVLGLHGPVFDVARTLRSLYAVIDSIETGEVGDCSTAVLIQREAFTAIDALWCSGENDQMGEEVTQELAERCWKTCKPCLERPGDGNHVEGQDTQDDIRAAAVRAVAASCRRHPGDSLGAIQSIFEACRLSLGNDELQECGFGVFSEKASSLPHHVIDEVMHHAVAWLFSAHARSKELTIGSDEEENYDAALTAVVSFVETTIALGSINDVIKDDVCALLCSHVEERINRQVIGGKGSLVGDSPSSTGVPRDHELESDACQSATVILQVLARLVNEREMFSLVMAERHTLLQKICDSCLEDVEGPMLLPALFCIGHVSKVSADACRLISFDLRETSGIDVTRSLVVLVAHAKQENIRQVAAWVLGVLGSSSSTAAQHVATSGGLLTMMDVMRRVDQCENLWNACYESCRAVISRLDSLATLVALLKLEVAGGDGARDGDGPEEDDANRHRRGLGKREDKGEKEEKDEGGDASECIDDSHELQSSTTIDGDGVVPPCIQETLFERIATLLENDVSVRPQFVQQGALEALISLGEMRPELEASMTKVCSLYPQELVDRCSPKYMRKLIDKFKRESCYQLDPKGQPQAGDVPEAHVSSQDSEQQNEEDEEDEGGDVDACD